MNDNWNQDEADGLLAEVLAYWKERSYHPDQSIRQRQSEAADAIDIAWLQQDMSALRQAVERFNEVLELIAVLEVDDAAFARGYAPLPPLLPTVEPLERLEKSRKPSARGKELQWEEAK